MTLGFSPLQLRQFHDDGYLVIRGAVARRQIEAARKAVNHSLGEDGIPPDDLPTLRQQTYCPHIRDQPVFTDLFNRSPVFDYMQSLVGEGNLLPAGCAQIALRFPHGKLPGEMKLRGHLDGVGTGLNTLAVGEFDRAFTALVVVLLQDLPEPWSGNFFIYPGSHRVAEAFFKTATSDVLAQGQPRLDLPQEAVQITGQAGDVCIAHHQIIHGAAPNHSPDIRYAAIFRACHVDVARNGTDVMTDIWREWPPVQEAVAETQDTPTQ